MYSRCVQGAGDPDQEPAGWLYFAWMMWLGRWFSVLNYLLLRPLHLGFNATRALVSTSENGLPPVALYDLLRDHFKLNAVTVSVVWYVIKYSKCL